MISNEKTHRTLQHRTVIGIIWNLFEQVGRRGVGLLITLLLARFLTPDAFGLIAMISVFINIANSFMEVGFVQALIRKPKLDQVDYATAFFANLLLSSLAYLLLFIFAPAISSFYAEDSLVALLRVAGVVLLFNSFHMVQVVELTRDLDFKSQLKITVPASLISGAVAIIMALLGFGVWSLITQIVLSAFFITILFNVMRPWTPSFTFSLDSLRQIVGFGSYLFLASLLDRIFKDLYVVVIARLFEAMLVGHYFFAQRIQQLVSIGLITIVQRVTYPAMAKIQDDTTRLKAAYRKLVQTVVYVVFPAMGMLSMLAPSLFGIFLQPEWANSASYLQLLCIVGCMTPLHSINLNILKVKGRSDLFFYLALIKKSMQLIILAISYRYGIYGIIVGMIVNSFFSYIPNSYFTVRFIGYTYLEQFKDILSALIGTLIMMLAIYALNVAIPMHTWSAVLASLIVGALVYVGFHGLNRSKSQKFFINAGWGILVRDE